MKFRNKFMTWMLSATMVASMTAPTVYAGESLSTSEMLEEDVISEELVEVSTEELESEDYTNYTVDLERETTTGPSLDIGGVVKDTYDVSVRQDLIGGSIIIEGDIENAKAEETITFTVSEESGYEVTSVAWWTVDETGNQVGELNKVTANEDGKYSFEMPESDVRIGAVFQDDLQLIGNKICEQGMTTEGLTTYAAFGNSCLNADETEAWIRLELDDRFFNEYKDMDDLTFTFELRQHKDKKYKVAGSQQYTIAELEAASTDNGDGTRDLKLFVDTANGKSLEADYQAYCYMTVTRDCWVDETGVPVYYKKNTSVDAKIIEAGKEKLVPTVFLYNLSADTFSGMLLREFLAGEGITFRDITNENLNQNLGYMAGWSGYEAVSAEEAYSPDTYDFSYLLYCNVSEVQVDAIMEARRQDNIKINYRSVLTEWGAKQSFAEMTKRIQKEDAAFKAALKLGVLMTEVRNLEASVYGTHPDWYILQASLENAIEVFSQEGEAEFYDAAYERLLKDYLLVTDKLQMEGQLEIILEDNQDGTYTVSTKVHPKEGEALKDYTFDYVWYDQTSESTITVKKEELYKITVYLDGRDNTHGFLYATLKVPSNPEFTVETTKTSIAVTVEEIEEEMNMPEVESYVVGLYKDGVLVKEQSQELAGTFSFEGLEEEATYTVKVKAINPVGYSKILESTVITTEDSNTGGSDNNETDTYNVSVRQDIIGGSVTVEGDIESAKADEMITFTISEESGYEVTSVGWWQVNEEGKRAGEIFTLTPDEEGKYAFEMPQADVQIGAAFQDDFRMLDNKIGGTTETNWLLYASLEDAFVYESEEGTHAQISMDERFLNADEDMMFKAELREYGEGGYRVVGEAEYDMATLRNMNYTNNPDGTVTFDHFEFKIDGDEDFTVGKKAYCLIQFSRACWVNAAGEPIYRWAYTEDATVLEDGEKKPEAIVWLYNLDTDSHRGSLIRRILEDLNIKIGTITNENLNQNIGYLSDWSGYEPNAEAYSPESYDLEYILMCNLSEVLLDAFLDGMQENNIRVNLKSVPTAWTASKTFSELFEIMAEEDEAFKAIIALDDLIYDAESLDEAEYGTNKHWVAFKKALAAANEALLVEEEQEAHFFTEVYDALLEAYLLVTEKEMLTGELELIAEKQVDGTYKVSAHLNGNVDATFDYKWQDNSTGNTLVSVAEKDLYKVKLEVKGTGDYYGKLSASLLVPADLEFSVRAKSNSLSVTFKEGTAALNTPEVDGYVAQLYLGDELVQEKEIEMAGTITFSGLSKKTTYTLKVYAYNEVGRGNILEETVTTKATSSSSSSDNSSSNISGSTDSNTTTEENKKDPSSETTTENDIKEDETITVKEFLDIKAEAWYSKAVQYVVSQGLMNGVTEDKFEPAMNLSRAMLAQILYNLAGKPVVNTTSNFTDVKQGVWYTDAIIWAANNGIVTGYGNGTFAPNAPITREQLAVMLYRYANSPEVNGDMSHFVDAHQVSEYAKKAMIWAVEEDIMNGKGQNNLVPTGLASRGEVAQMLQNYLENK